MLAFLLSLVDRYRAEIERGLGRSILSVLIRNLDDHHGGRYELRNVPARTIALTAADIFA
jgi:hypothetical protein